MKRQASVGMFYLAVVGAFVAFNYLVWVLG